MIRQARILLKIMSTLLRTSHLWQMEVIDSSVIIVYKESGTDFGVGVLVVDRVPTFTGSFCA